MIQNDRRFIHGNKCNLYSRQLDYFLNKIPLSKSSGGKVKYFIFACMTMSSVFAFACPNFTGKYSGSCQVSGTDVGDIKKTMVIAIFQNGCDKFIFNDLVTPSKYYTSDKASLYVQDTNDTERSLRKAHIFDNGKTIHLNETYINKSEKFGDKLISGTAIFKKINNSTISYSSERFDLLSEKLLKVTCTELKNSK